MTWIVGLLVAAGIVGLVFMALTIVAGIVTWALIMFVAGAAGFAIGSALHPDGGIAGAGLAVILANILLINFGSKDDEKKTSSSSAPPKQIESNPPPSTAYKSQCPCGSGKSFELCHGLRA